MGVDGGLDGGEAGLHHRGHRRHRRVHVGLEGRRGGGQVGVGVGHQGQGEGLLHNLGGQGLEG